MTNQTELLIGNSFELGQEAKEQVLNPRTGGLILEVPEASTAQVDRAVAAARKAFDSWSRTTPGERSAALLRIADRIEAEADAFAALEALNCGKPINAANYRIGTAARDGNDYLVYDTGTNKLYFDPDGSGPETPKLIATIPLTGSSAPAASDFLLMT